MTKYTFRTIVAPDDVRVDFTALRDRLNTSDKELMQALWNLAMRNIQEVEVEVEELQDIAKANREVNQQIKAAAKLRMKEMKKLAPLPVEEFVEEEGEMETVVVDGLQ